MVKINFCQKSSQKSGICVLKGCTVTMGTNVFKTLFSIVPMVSWYKRSLTICYINFEIQNETNRMMVIVEGQEINYLLNVLNQWFLNFKIHSLYSFNEMLFIVTLKQTLKHYWQFQNLLQRNKTICNSQTKFAFNWKLYCITREYDCRKSWCF